MELAITEGGPEFVGDTVYVSKKLAQAAGDTINGENTIYRVLPGSSENVKLVREESSTVKAPVQLIVTVNWFEKWTSV